MEKLTEWVSPKELARRLKLHKNTILKRARSGEFPHAKIGQRVIRFDYALIKAIVDNATMTTTTGENE